MRKLLIFIVGGSVTAGVACWLWLTLAVVPVQAARVRVGEITEFVDIEAKTRVERTYKLTMPISGRLEAIALNPGARVVQGQMLAQLVAQDLTYRVDELSATVARLKASIQEAEFEGVEQAELDQSLKMVDMMQEVAAGRESQVTARSSELAFASAHLSRILKTKHVYPKDEIESAESNRDIKQAEVDRDRHDHRSSTEGIEVAAYRAAKFRNELIRKRLHVTSLKFAREEAEARLHQVLLDQERSCMKSPVEGIVVTRFVSDERVLQAGTELLEVARLDDLEVVAEVLTQDASRIRPGARVEVYGPSLGGKIVIGAVQRIEPQAYTKISSLGVEEQRVNVIISFDPGIAQHLFESYSLGIGFRVRVRIDVAHHAQTKIVPRFAIFRGPNATWQILVVRSGTAQLLTVQVGLLNDESAEIIAGVHEDDVVLLAPDRSLGPSTRVRPEFTQPPDT